MIQYKTKATMKLQDIITDVIDKEIAGLQALKKHLDFVIFSKIIDKIQSLNGKIIITGLGKSGYIGKKIVATLCSIGVPAVFLHSGEALHGDIGIISSNDIVMLLSNSGEGNEIKYIVNFCNQRNIITIGISREKSSYLIYNTTIALCLPPIPEASNFDIPTTSSVMMLALGDVITIALKEIKQLSIDTYHPSGKIGLYNTKVGDLMIKDLPIVKGHYNVNKILLIMVEKKLNIALVIDKFNNLLGIISDIKHKTQYNQTAIDLMTQDYQQISINDAISDVNKYFDNYEFCIVLDNKHPIGLLTKEHCKC